MTEPQDAGGRTDQTDVLYLSDGRSVPRDLHRQHGRQKQLYCAAALWPLVLPLFYLCLPTTALIFLATPVNDLFWSHLRPISLEVCGAKCSLVAFSLIAVPLAWLGAAVVGVFSAVATTQFISAQDDALRRGLAPMGRMPDGTAKLRPSGAGAFFMTIPAMMIAGALLLWFSYVLYEIGGSDRTAHARTGTEYAPVLVTFFMTFLMSVVQVIAAILPSYATFIANDLMSFATFLANNLKRLLRI